MGVSLNSLLADANRNLQEDNVSVVTTSEREDACRTAVKEYSRIRPQLKQQAYTGAVSDRWYDLPTDYEDGLSVIYEIEYPIERNPKEIITKDSFYVDLMSDGLKLRFGSLYPASGETFWAKFTGAYSFDSNGDSDIREVDQKGLSYLCTSIMCEMFSSFYATKANPSLANAEVLEYESRVSEYNTRANKWRALYAKTIRSNLTGTYNNIPFIDNSYWDRTNQ